MSMIENVAREICASEYPHDGSDSEKAKLWNQLDEYDRAVYLCNARAAMQAMMEPTEEMMAKGKRQDHWARNHRLTWQAMIQAALDEKP